MKLLLPFMSCVIVCWSLQVARNLENVVSNQTARLTNVTVNQTVNSSVITSLGIATNTTSFNNNNTLQNTVENATDINLVASLPNITNFDVNLRNGTSGSRNLSNILDITNVNINKSQLPSSKDSQVEEILSHVGPGDKSTIKYEARLLRDIMGNYSAGMRPVQSSKVPAKINFDMRLGKLVDLDTKSQVLVIDAFVIMRWVDPQLQWNPRNYNGTDIVNIPSSKVWTPDIVLYNNAVNIGKAHTDIYSAPVVVLSNGSIVWTNAVTLKASCDIAIKQFPFDTQECPMTFGSWSYSASRLRIGFISRPQSKADLSQSNGYVTNGVWELIDANSTLSTRRYSCCAEPFSQVEYKFTLKRRPTFFLLYLVFPCMAICSLSLVSYVIPPEAGERIGYGVTVMLSFSVYLIVISDKLPENSDTTPLLGILYVVSFYLLVFSFVASTFNIRLYYAKTRPPQWLVTLAKGSKRTCTISFRKKQKIGDLSTKVDLRPAEKGGHEIKGKGAVDADFESSGEAEASSEKMENKEDLYQEQWREISAFLDNVFFMIVAFGIIATPVIVTFMF
ncbi:neuronal acetylcholine receptor subunit alpha-5-like [Rhopilema esculentum]|uniref:neuronal acetylcholine receptor subunit alpha-5-like n=1 Tax=Rhopilema esculentum TaxID=499914 RepID=UPI0031D11CDE